MSWKIFIITHGPVIDNYYEKDLSFSNEHYTFINVSNELISHSKFEVVNKNEIKDFIHLGKWYAEGEAIYNVFKNNLYDEYDYIGFLHWDYELLSEITYLGSNITSIIDKIIDKKNQFISFSTFRFEDDYNQKIMMDNNYPDQLVGEGKNCWETIISDYNRYFKNDIDVEYLMTKRINLCSAFMCNKLIFEDLMGFYSEIIESKKLDFFDSNHQYRFQGGMLERYIGCFSHKFSMVELPLYHRWSGSSQTFSIPLKKRIKSKILNLWKKLIKK